MTPGEIDRVFGRGRLQMVTGKHVEVFREASTAGARRRYTKRFLHTAEADYGQWTEREWRILARLIGHGIACVPEVVQYDRGAPGGTQLVQTYDAGATVDQWATILPVTRRGRTLRHVFEDCAHWWALAHHCLRALQAIHELSVVHLDIKGDNVCIPVGPAGFDPHGADLRLFPRYADLALIDFAFSLVSRESLTTALPIGWQPDYDYQSPRLLHALEAGRRGDLQPTRQLDWRCDMYSLAAMLKRYLPHDDDVHGAAQAEGWSATHLQAARELILALREAHDGEATARFPHAHLLERTEARLAEAELASSLAAGWELARDAIVTPVAATPATPVTRLAPPLRVLLTPRVNIDASDSPVDIPGVVRRRGSSPPLAPPPLSARARPVRAFALATVLVFVTVGAIGVGAPDVVDRWTTFGEVGQRMSTAARAMFERAQPRVEALAAAATSDADVPAPAPVTPATPAEQADAGSTKVVGSETAQATAPAPTADAAQAPTSEASSPALPRAQEEKRAEPALPTRSAQAQGKKANAPPIGAVSRAPPASASARSAAGRSTRTAAVPSSPPKVAQARPRPGVATASKISPATTVAAAPRRSWSFESEMKRITAAAREGAPVNVPVAPAGEKAAPSAAPPEPPAALLAPAPAESAPPAKLAQAPTPPKATPPATSEPRNTVPFLPDLTLRRERGSAPIEERSVPSASASSAPVPAEDARMAAVPPPVEAVPSPPAASPPIASRPPPRVLAPRYAQPGNYAPPYTRRADAAETLDLAAQARRTIAESVPYAAARAQGEAARVLRVAAHATNPGQESDIVDAVRRGWTNHQIATGDAQPWPGGARQLSDEARQAYVVQRNARQAYELQLRAFGANPRDPDIAGALAFLVLEVDPGRAETARQLALHAIALRSSQTQGTHVDDWSTLAIASALTGRESDTTHAWYVTVALSRDLDRSCRVALGAVARHGDVMVAPVQRMMWRIRQHGRDRESPNCSWPGGSRIARGY